MDIETIVLNAQIVVEDTIMRGREALTFVGEVVTDLIGVLGAAL